MSKLKILVVPANDGGCAYYRAWLPFNKLVQHFPDRVEVKFNKNPLGIIESGDKIGQYQEGWEFEDIKWADVVMTQNLSNFGGPYTARIIQESKNLGKIVHYDTDDLLTEVYEGHRLAEVYKERKLSEITKWIYAHSDIVTVTQRKFAERIQPFCGPQTTLAVIKNAIDYDLPCWNMPKREPPRKKVCRVGWVGGIHHERDVKEFTGVPFFVNQKVGKENVIWDFYGRPPIPPNGEKDWQQDVWDNYQQIILKGFRGGGNYRIHTAQGPDRYGEFYTNMDLAIAPLEFNNFNDSKSEIKVAECGRYGIPLVATNCGCYDETIINGQTGYLIDKSNPRSDWIKIMTKLIKDKKGREEMGRNLKEITDKYFNINNVVGFRLELYETVIERMLKKEEEEVQVESKDS